MEASLALCHCALESDRPAGSQGQLLAAETGWVGTSATSPGSSVDRVDAAWWDSACSLARGVVGLLSIEMKTADWSREPQSGRS